MPFSPASVCALGAVVLLSTGCDFLPGHDTDVRLRTDRDFYHAQTDTIYLSATNRSEAPVYYLCTGPVVLQELSGKRITKSWGVHGFEYCGRISPLEPGETLTFEFDLGEAFFRERFTDARFDESVHYRFEFDLHEDSALKQSVSEEDRLSNEFSILRR